MKITAQGSILSNLPISIDTYHLVVGLSSFDGSILPGQFAQLSTQGIHSTFLKRPISVYGCKDHQVEFIYKVVGQGTSNLSDLLPDQKIELIFPLGNSFSPPPSQTSRILLIGGGMGVAPLVYYIRYYQPLVPLASFTLYYGVSREAEKIDLAIPDPLSEKFLFHADFLQNTFQGNLLDFYMQNSPETYDLVLACGPTPMMKAFSDHFHQNNTAMEVSLESSMACGYGVCLGCAFSTKEGSKTVCVDGPVFSSNIIDWNKVWTH
jgi:dihydroorotate dehydrogenase electron transfer subunit